MDREQIRYEGESVGEALKALIHEMSKHSPRMARDAVTLADNLAKDLHKAHLPVSVVALALAILLAESIDQALKNLDEALASRKIQ